jgi:hypothetical protein
LRRAVVPADDATVARSLILVVAAVLTAALVSSAAAAVGVAEAVAPAWKNCTRVHKTYPHGVGKVGARDHTSGTPVTTFKRSKALYLKAKHLDRDGDGIACESR